MFSIFLVFLSIGPVFATLRGIMQYEIQRMTQQRIDGMVLDIAKHNIWNIHFCKNDMLYYEFNDEHLYRIKNIFPNRSISYTEDGYCKFILVE